MVSHFLIGVENNGALHSGFARFRLRPSNGRRRRPGESVRLDLVAFERRNRRASLRHQTHRPRAVEADEDGREDLERLRFRGHALRGHFVLETARLRNEPRQPEIILFVRADLLRRIGSVPASLRLARALADGRVARRWLLRVFVGAVHE